MDEPEAHGGEVGAVDRRRAGKLGLAVTGGALVEAAGGPAQRQAAGHGGGALALLREAEASELGPGVIEELLEDVQRLAVAAETMPPRAVLAEVEPALGRLPGLLRLRMPVSQRQDLLTVAAALLYRSACARFDSGEYGAALADWRVALRLAQQAGNGELAASVLEAQGWILVFLERAEEAIARIEQGKELARSASVVMAHLLGQEARARGHMGDREGAAAALHQAERVFAGLDERHAPIGIAPSFMLYEAHSYGYAAQVYLLAGEPAKAVQAARRAIKAWAPGGSGPGSGAGSPTLVTLLALALAHTGKPDEACHTALQGFQAGTLTSRAVLRARKLADLVAARYPALPQLRDLREALRAVPA